MQRCWHVHAWRRPTFDQLVSESSDIVRALIHSRRHSSAARSSGIPAADVGLPSVSAPDASDGSVSAPPVDYLLPTPRCSDCVRREDDHVRSSQPSDGDVLWVHERQSAPPFVVYDRPTSSAVYQVPPATSSVQLDTDQLPWRCTAV